MTANAHPTLAIVAPTAYRLGGVQTWLDYLVPALEQQGWPVAVLLLDGRHHDAGRYLAEHPFSRTVFVRSATGSREGRIEALMAAFGDVDPDLVLGVNVVDVFEAVARLRARGETPRVAMALHGQQTSFFEDIRRNRQLLDGVVATNRLGAAMAGECLGDDTRSFYAPCGVPIGAIAEAADPVETLQLRFAGRFDEAEKRVLLLPRILEELERRRVDFELRLAGTGPEEGVLRSALAGFGERVVFEGVLDPARLASGFFAPGAVALILSPAETGPISAWEAMAAGAALVSSRYLGSVREGSLWHGDNCMLFEVDDASGAADAIASLADARLRARIARSGRGMVETRYSREASVASWTQALATIAGRDSLPALPPTEQQKSGRLDVLLGVPRAERVRRLLQLEHRHQDAGGEWPHSYGAGSNPGIARRLRELDMLGRDHSPIAASS